LGVPPLDIPFDFGWMYLNLNLPVDAPTGDVDFPVPAGLLAQSYVTAEHSALGLYTVGLSAIELTSACEDLNPIINDGIINIIPFY
ncbi:MAG: hypothetical protein GY856_25345, partial [bacterium]|nr:hypothetical protein [bacterium]